MTFLISPLAWLAVGLLRVLALSLGDRHLEWSPVVDPVRSANERFFAPRQMQTAGTPGAFAGIVRHGGRTSAKGYPNRLGVKPTDDGFLGRQRSAPARSSSHGTLWRELALRLHRVAAADTGGEGGPSHE
jgi:hypothetical protein